MALTRVDIETVKLARELIERQLERETEVFELGYRLGFAAGADVGYGRANHEMDRTWAPLAASVRRLADQPSHAELVRRRAEQEGEPL